MLWLEVELMQDEIMVSIHCLAYNHEKYIAQTLESFLKQKTSFKYEVLIHDVASTDNKANIIRKYENMYPNIIKPIYQTENQYKKKTGIWRTYQLPRVKGKYVAVCEGDDYWIDEYKLQKQVEYMEANPECTLTFHNAIVVDTEGQTLQESFLPKNEFYSCYFRDVSSVYTTDDMIKLDFAPTNSLMFRTRDVNKYIDFYHMRDRVCGDLIMRILYSSFGYAYYFSDKMSAYRMGVADSASQRANSSDEAKIKTLNGHLEILNDFDQYTNHQYKQSIEEIKKLKIFLHYFDKGSTLICRKDEYRIFWKRASIKTRIGFYFRAHFVNIYHLLKKIRRV